LDIQIFVVEHDDLIPFSAPTKPESVYRGSAADKGADRSFAIAIILQAGYRFVRLLGLKDYRGRFPG
jgi:hypothetical protein